MSMLLNSRSFSRTQWFTIFSERRSEKQERSSKGSQQQRFHADQRRRLSRLRDSVRMYLVPNNRKHTHRNKVWGQKRKLTCRRSNNRKIQKGLDGAVSLTSQETHSWVRLGGTEKWPDLLPNGGGKKLSLLLKYKGASFFLYKCLFKIKCLILE